MAESEARAVTGGTMPAPTFYVRTCYGFAKGKPRENWCNGF